MTPLEQRKKALTSAIFSLFNVWFIAVVSMNAVIGLGLVVSKRWLPFYVIGFLLFIFITGKSRLGNKGTKCYRIPAITTLVLFLSALIMIVINIIGVDWQPGWVKPQPFNQSIPYVCALIVYPVCFFCSLWYLAIGRRSLACVHCQIRHGSYTERGLIAKLFQQESNVQIKALCIGSALISIIDWCYYFLYYVNVNYNSRDIFMFILLPTALTAISLIFFYTRYAGMWRYYCHNPAMESIHGHSTVLRFIVIVGDHILLDPYNTMIVDTPVKCFMPFTTDMPLSRATDAFRNLTGITPVNIVRAYESEETTTLANTYHYLCFFNSVNQLQGSKVPGQLYSYKRVITLLQQKLLAPELRSELERIYTVAMTWKTYTLDGKRIYPIKNYKPSFRFKDIKDYKVDYNDKRWLAVTANNEDKRFFKLRRFWNKHVNGF